VILRRVVSPDPQELHPEGIAIAKKEIKADAEDVEKVAAKPSNQDFEKQRKIMGNKEDFNGENPAKSQKGDHLIDQPAQHPFFVACDIHISFNIAQEGSDPKEEFLDPWGKPVRELKLKVTMLPAFLSYLDSGFRNARENVFRNSPN